MEPADRCWRVLLVAEDTLFRRGLREVLAETGRTEVVAESADAAEVLACVGHLRPGGLDSVLVDLDLDTLDALSLIRRVRAQDPDLPVVALGWSELEADVLSAWRAGALGYLAKSLPPAELARALVEFARGGVVPISRASASSILRHLWAEQAARCASPLAAETDHHHVASWDDLTTREREVVQLVAMGARDREIAQQLVVSHNTVKKHVKSILHKLGARNRAEAAARLTHTRIRNRS